MASPLDVLAFDADDTLWQNETFYRLTEDRFVDLLAEHADRDGLSARLLAAERRNLALYGYGIKGFTLSMIETALEVTEGRVAPAVIGEILAIGRALLGHPIEPLPHAREALTTLSASHRLLLVTKGDLFDQERKLAQSGLGDLFEGVEIVSEKSPEVYARVFARHGARPEHALMAGNSLKSDVLPVLAIGAHGVHVPHPLTWALEHAEAPDAHPRFHRIDDLGGLPALVAVLEERG